MERPLLVLTAGGLLHRGADGAFGVDPTVAPYLDGGHPRYIGGFVKHMVDAFEQLPRLEQYLARGKDTVDASLPAPYDHFYSDDLSTAEFMSAMWGLSYDVSRELVALAGLDGDRTLVDVGGASGPFAVAALELVPELHAVVFDLPQVRPHLEQTREKYGLTDRLDFVGGDFFRDELPACEVIAFGYVMSNWPDPECRLLLDKAFRACAPGGRALVMERLFDEDKNGPLSTAVMNLTMQVETRGVHRTPAELSALLSGAGFLDCEVLRSGRDKHLIIGRKPS